MRAGALRQRVTIQVLVETTDPYGQLIQTWTDVLADEPAEILTIGGGEQANAQQQTAVSTHTVRIRWRPSVEILPTMRVLYLTKVFEIIQAKDVDFRHEEVRLMCRELVGAPP